MLRPDVQAEIILSFQEERRQQLAQLRERERVPHKHRRPVHTRLLVASGGLLIAGGRRLQQLAGNPPAELKSQRLGEVA